MVQGMRIVKDLSEKKKSEFYYLEIDFGYRVAKVFDLDPLLYPELCGVTAAEFYSMAVGQSLPVKIAGKTKE